MVCFYVRLSFYYTTSNTFFFVVLTTESRALYMLRRCSTTELYPQPLGFKYKVIDEYFMLNNLLITLIFYISPSPSSLLHWFVILEIALRALIRPSV